MKRDASTSSGCEEVVLLPKIYVFCHGGRVLQRPPFSYRRCGINKDSGLIYNERVRWKEVRVIDENNGQLGIMASDAALELAYSKGLDLIVVAPNATPPVCKIMDLGKYQYEQLKRQKEAKKKQVTVEMKEMKYRLRIDIGDLTVKNQHLKEFLSEGNRVRVTIMFRGREMAFPDQGRALLMKIAAQLASYGTITQEPKMQGRNMSMIMEPSKEALAKMKGSGKE